MKPNINSLDKPIILVHIEKTAGTAFTEYLYSHMSSEEDVASPYMGQPITEFFGKFDKKLYFGHLSYNECLNINLKGYLCTFLRHPLDRARSQYRSWHNPKNLSDAWISAISKSEVDAVRAVQEMSFQEYVMSDNPLIIGHINNLMSRRLAKDPWGPIVNLDTAFDVLQNEFYYFGIVEFFKKSMEIFKYKFSGAKEYLVPDENSNISVAYDASLDAIAQQRLYDLNEYDFKLYNNALALFNERYASINKN